MSTQSLGNGAEGARCREEHICAGSHQQTWQPRCPRNRSTCPRNGLSDFSYLTNKELEIKNRLWARLGPARGICLTSCVTSDPWLSFSELWFTISKTGLYADLLRSSIQHI